MLHEFISALPMSRWFGTFSHYVLSETNLGPFFLLIFSTGRTYGVVLHLCFILVQISCISALGHSKVTDKTVAGVSFLHTPFPCCDVPGVGGTRY